MSLDLKNDVVITRGTRSGTPPENFLTDSGGINTQSVKDHLLDKSVNVLGIKDLRYGQVQTYSSNDNIRKRNLPFAYEIQIVLTQEEREKLGSKIELSRSTGSMPIHRLGRWGKTAGQTGMETFSISKLPVGAAFNHIKFKALREEAEELEEMIRNNLILFGGKGKDVGDPLEPVYVGPKAKEIMAELEEERLAELKNETKNEVSGRGPEGGW